MRYLMALMLVWGVCQFSSAQTDQNQNTDCPPKVEGQTENEGVEMDNADADLQYEDDAYVRGNEGQELESDELQDPKSDFDAADAGTEFDMESDEADIDAESDINAPSDYDAADAETDINADTDFDAADAETDIDMETETAPGDTGMLQDQSKDCPNLDESSSDAGNVTNYETTNIIVVEEQEKERSTFGKIWRSPFKMVANIPKAAVSVVSESAEGVGHIVGAPFKGVGKLFGAEENDDKGLSSELDEKVDENI